MENEKKSEGRESGNRLPSLREEVHADRAAERWRSDKAELTRLGQLNQVRIIYIYIFFFTIVFGWYLRPWSS